MGRLMADVAPLRESPQFRLMYLGMAVAEMGRQMTVVALPVQVFFLTGSSLMVGLVSLVQIVPLVLGSLIGGTIADVVDRRRVLMVVQLALALCGVALALNATRDSPLLWPLFLAAAVSAAFSGADSPTRKATVPRLVRREQLTSAFALLQVLRQTANAVAPAVAGLVLARFGADTAFWLAAATFLGAFFVMTQMAPLPPSPEARRPGFAALGEGVSYLRSRPLLATNFAVDLDAMVLAAPKALFPEIGTVLLGGNAATVGYLYAAPGFGALLGALTSGWVSHVQRQGRAVVLAVGVWGAAMVVLGTSRNLALALLALAVAGAADVVSSVFRSTILQLAVPDQLRGRLSAIHTSVVAGGPRLGDAQAGAVAAAVGAPLAVTLGGLACIGGLGVIVAKVPKYWQLVVTGEDLE